MITDEAIKQHYYRALLQKSPKFEGLFFFALTSTGIFCRATCPARKPNYKYCVFFEEANEALQHHFRPCQRCSPLSDSHSSFKSMNKMLRLIEQSPEKRWSEKEIVSVGVDPSVLRKQCKKRFGMTFLSFSRLRRVAAAILDLQSGNALLDTQIKYGFESSSGFRDACRKVLSDKSSGLEGVLHVDWIDTRLGTLVAVSRYNRLYYLNFINEIDVSYQLRQLSSFFNSVMIPSPQPVHFLLRSELKSYFKDFKLNFCVPMTLSGSSLEQAMLQRIVAIPVGSTELWVDILDEDQVTEKEISFEQLIQSNPLALLVPLHRVTTGHAMTNDRFTLDRASWLLRHECNQ